MAIVADGDDQGKQADGANAEKGQSETSILPRSGHGRTNRFGGMIVGLRQVEAPASRTDVCVTCILILVAASTGAP